MKLESKGTVDYAAQLDAKLKHKQKELEAHEAHKPAAVDRPSNLTPEESAANAEIADELEQERVRLSAIETQIANARAQRTSLTEQIALAKKLEGRLDNFVAEFTRLKQECAPDLAKLSLDMGAIVTLKIDKNPLTQTQDSLAATKGAVDAALSPTDDKGLPRQKATCEGRIKALQDKLDAPNKRYQAYQEALKAWQEQRDTIVGSADKADSLRYYEAQIRYIKERLPAEVADIRAKRREAAGKAHASIAAIKDVYVELFAPVQKLIEDSIIIKEGFKLTFDSSIIERTFQRDFFETYIHQGLAGSFCGKEKGAAALEELRAEYDFGKPNDAIGFVEKITAHLERDMRTPQQAKMNIGSQLRKRVELKALYDYLWTLRYLEPEYSLKLDGKDLSHLSPGERGTLLLVFYLLVDKSNKPIIV